MNKQSTWGNYVPFARGAFQIAAVRKNSTIYRVSPQMLSVLANDNICETKR